MPDNTVVTNAEKLTAANAINAVMMEIISRVIIVPIITSGE